VRGENAPLPPAADLAAYRVVQEALTNALKYAERARTEVVLDYRDEGLALEVVDEGPGTAHNGAGGRGLTGLAERVAVCGGTFSAGRRPSGGFAVRAWLPNIAAAP
ncbi:MAG: histidine kinase, dimerization and phosphoacceptor region, partial [Candidatus Dormibacteraeota bacterium]|nr:histidine kinase, dimerization and phosphoacceptor region [Candidatus Dormibacteraeota bacterium]